jgi:small multidrug resistance pump
MSGKFYLIATILVETLAVALMKMANGGEQKIMFSFAMLSFLASFLLLSQALKTMDMGLTNAIWAGSSTLLIYLVSIAFFQEKVNWQQGIFLLFIIIGIAGLNYFTKK